MSVGISNKKLFHFSNGHHLGDNFLNLRFFLYISSILKEKNIFIYYYYSTEWKFNKEEKLMQLVDPETVALKPYHLRPASTVELWQGIPINGVGRAPMVEHYFSLFYEKIINHLGISPEGLQLNLWLDQPFLQPIYDSLDEKYKNIDILILNNKGYSGQCNDHTPVNDLAKHLSLRFDVVVSDSVGEGIKNAECLTLKQIGAISLHAKWIITTNSSPSILCYNTTAKANVKKWFYYPAGIGILSVDNMPTNNIHAIRQYFDSIPASR